MVELSSFHSSPCGESPDRGGGDKPVPNHLDVHKDMQEYIDAKKNILLHQGALSRTVLNAGNEITVGFAPEVRGDCWMFRRGAPVERGVWCDGENIYVHGEKLLEVSQIKIPGWHNVENYMAAIAAVWGGRGAPDHPPCGGNLCRGGAPGGVRPGAGGRKVLQRLHRHQPHPGHFWDAVPVPPEDPDDRRGYDKHIPFEPLGPAVCEKV